MRIRVIFEVLGVATICALLDRPLQGRVRISSNLPPHRPQTHGVDINAASLDQLLKVPGMTRTWAARIIRYRPYHAKNDLVDRGVVTSQVYDRIKDYIIAHRAKP